MRLDWGCGPDLEAGWVGSDLVDWGQEHVGDIRDGLPWDDGTFDYAVTNHALQMVPWADLVPTLAELRRVVSGWVRILVPDLTAALWAFHRADAGHFQVADEHEHSIDGKLCMYLTQAGSTRSLFTAHWLAELCERAGFSFTHHAAPGLTITGIDGIVGRDSRPAESLIIEARR